MTKITTSTLSFSHRLTDEVAELFGRRFSPVKIEPLNRKGILDLRGVYGQFDGIDFNRTEFKIGFQIFPQERDRSYFFLFPTRCEVSVMMGHHTIVADADKATASYGETMDAVRFASGLRKTALSIEKTLLRQRLSVLLDRSIEREIKFEPVVDQRAGRLPVLIAFLRFLNDPDFGESISETPLACRQLSTGLIDLLLEAWPHNFSDRLYSNPPLIAPKHVKRAIEYIRENLLTDYSMEDVARASGVSLRALQYGFRHFVGKSPVAYDRELRLQLARKLLETDRSLTVSEVSRLTRFSNSHRFSLAFKERFGENPASFSKYGSSIKSP